VAVGGCGRGQHAGRPPLAAPTVRSSASSLRFEEASLQTTVGDLPPTAWTCAIGDPAPLDGGKGLPGFVGSPRAPGQRANGCQLPSPRGELLDWTGCYWSLGRRAWLGQVMNRCRPGDQQAACRSASGRTSPRDGLVCYPGSAAALRAPILAAPLARDGS